jgi:hypothetical protein
MKVWSREETFVPSGGLRALTNGVRGTISKIRGFQIGGRLFHCSKYLAPNNDERTQRRRG